MTGEAARQPDVEAAKNSTAKAARSSADVTAALAGAKAEEIPRLVANFKMQGVLDDAGAQTHIASEIANHIDSRDTASLVSLLNAQKKTINDPKIAAMPNVASVALAKGANGEEYLVMKDAQGQQIMAKPVSTFRNARDSLQKPQAMKVKDGEAVVSLRGGKATELYRAPESAAGKSAKQGPLERDVNYLVSGHGMSKEQALDHLNAAKSMSKEQYILKSMEGSRTRGTEPT